ncbi:MAG TPA: hypothetical protein PKH93_09235, partial [Chitinophagales bacterium]|nr:hypothetical protein [Chitinophagales bacterium]
MNDAANTGLMTNATINDAKRVMMSVTGRKNMNFPIMPCQKAKGTKGARVVSVPAKTGTKISPAARLAA